MVTLRKIKYLGINLAKEVKDLYSEYYGTLKNEIKENIRKGRDLLFLGRKNQQSENDHSPKIITQIK